MNEEIEFWRSVVFDTSSNSAS